MEVHFGYDVIVWLDEYVVTVPDIFCHKLGSILLFIYQFPLNSNDLRRNEKKFKKNEDYKNVKDNSTEALIKLNEFDIDWLITQTYLQCMLNINRDIFSLSRAWEPASDDFIHSSLIFSSLHDHFSFCSFLTLFFNQIGRVRRCRWIFVCLLIVQHFIFDPKWRKNSTQFVFITWRHGNVCDS